MNLSERRIKESLNKFLWLIIFVIVAAHWSWLLAIDASTLAEGSLLAWALKVFCYITIVGISFGAIWGFMWAIRRLRIKPTLLTCLCIALCWAAMEWLLAYLLNLIWYGAGGSFDSILPFSSLSYIGLATPLVYLARLGGFYGMSAVISFTGLLACHRALRRHLLWVIPIIALLTLTSWMLYRTPDGSQVTVATVAESLGEQIDMVDARQSQLIVLPEYGLDVIDAAKPQRSYSSLAENYFVIGTKQTDTFPAVNRLIAFNESNNEVDSRQKARLIPGGEYLPYIGEAILSATGQKDVKFDFMVRRLVQKGDARESKNPLRLGDGLVVGAFACSSIIAPEDYRHSAARGATLFTNSASLEIFNGSPVFDWQYAQLARFIAVSNARYFVQSANDNASFVLDHNGNRIASAQPLGVAYATVLTQSVKTPYTLMGEWVPLTGLAIAAGYLIAKIVPRRTRLNKDARTSRRSMPRRDCLYLASHGLNKKMNWGIIRRVLK